MADKDVLWTAVKAAYAEATLLPLTSIHDRTATTIGASQDAVGTSAAEHVIGLWPSCVESEFDIADVTHLANAIEGTVAVLYKRGGTSSAVAKEEWDAVFGDSGLMSKLRRTTVRGRRGPSTSGPDTSSSGGDLRPWSDNKSMPVGFLPARRGVNFNDD